MMDLSDYEKEIEKINSQDHISKQDEMIKVYCQEMIKHKGNWGMIKHG